MEQDFAHLVLVQLQRRRLSLSKIAAVANVHRSSLGRWLSGKRGMNVAAAARVMAIVGLRVISQEDLDALSKARPATPRVITPARTPRPAH